MRRRRPSTTPKLPASDDGEANLEHDDERRLARALAAWASHDLARALHSEDRTAVESTLAVRSLVLELFGPTAHGRDLFNACARLGGLLAEGGATPSLAATTVDGAAH